MGWERVSGQLEPWMAELSLQGCDAKASHGGPCMATLGFSRSRDCAAKSTCGVSGNPLPAHAPPNWHNLTELAQSQTTIGIIATSNAATRGHVRQVPLPLTMECVTTSTGGIQPRHSEENNT